MPPPVQYAVYSGFAPDEVWQEVAEVFVEAFTAAPYFEDPTELGTIVQWGPEQVRHRGGRLVTATCDGRLVGFALGHGLRDDPAWQDTLAQLAGEASTAADALVSPSDNVIVHELAVRASERGRGIAGTCLYRLLEDRSESQTFIGVYQRATEAASMYRHWGLRDIGQVPLPDEAIALHVLTAPTAELLARMRR